MHFRGGRLATFVTDLRLDLPCTAVIAGKTGQLVLGPPFWSE